MAQLGSTDNGTLLLAVKEVNTPEANLGDLLSYTVTLTNLTNETLTNMTFNDLIDKSLEVEQNSIGINGAASCIQRLADLKIPDLLPQSQSEIVFNTYIKRIPNTPNNTLRESAEVTFNYQNAQYKVSTTSAVTAVQVPDTSPEFLNASMTANSEEVMVGGKIKYTLRICPNSCYALTDIWLNITLDNNQQFIPCTLVINGYPSDLTLNQIYLPDLTTIGGRINIVEFETQVISQPNAIRALVSAKGIIHYRVSNYNHFLTAITNEVLTEVVPPALLYNYSINVPIAKIIPNIRYIDSIIIDNTDVIPAWEQTGMSIFNISYRVSVNYTDCNGQSMTYGMSQILPVNYPYSSQSKIKIWTDYSQLIFDAEGMLLKIYVEIQN